ncbi:MAG: hypothetical protein J7M40_06775 [Planctomycetes bacterium]|nr:hypothetical protein [Planctomycetota bacterium]
MFGAAGFSNGNAEHVKIRHGPNAIPGRKHGFSQIPGCIEAADLCLFSAEAGRFCRKIAGRSVFFGKFAFGRIFCLERVRLFYILLVSC